MKSRKILHVIASVNPSSGGPVETLKQLSNEMTKLGYSIECLTLDELGSPWLVNFPFKVYPLGPGFMKYRYSSKLIPWLNENYHHYDFIVVNGIWQYHSLGVWRALSQKDIPYFVFTHGMLDPWFKRKYPFKHLKKLIYWFLGEYRVLRDARAVIFTTDEERLLARKSFCLYKCNEAVVSYGTAAPPPDSARLIQSFIFKYRELTDKRIVLYLGRIHEKKGCDLLIGAFASVAHLDRDLHLVFVGPGTDKILNKLKNQAVILGIDNRILWAGLLEGDDKWGAYYAAEVFCLPSHQENFGIAVIEALGTGTPVLISNKVNIYREIELDDAGIVSDDTLEGMTKSLQRWLALTLQQKEAMERASINCFYTRYENSRMAKSLLQILHA